LVLLQVLAVMKMVVLRLRLWLRLLRPQSIERAARGSARPETPKAS
jgi:hypothetical protein